MPLNDIIIDPENRDILYVASDVGVFISENQGSNWQPLGDGLPNVPITDMDFHNPTRTLVAATYGRSMYRLNVGDVTSVEPRPPVPAHFALYQNFPNPFNPETTIRFDLQNTSQVRLQVYDILGRHVRTLIDESVSAGGHRINWDGRDDSGHAVASGTYIYRLENQDRILARRMVLLR